MVFLKVNIYLPFKYIKMMLSDQTSAKAALYYIWSFNLCVIFVYLSYDEVLMSIVYFIKETKGQPV